MKSEPLSEAEAARLVRKFVPPDQSATHNLFCLLITGRQFTTEDVVAYLKEQRAPPSLPETACDE